MTSKKKKPKKKPLEVFLEDVVSVLSTEKNEEKALKEALEIFSTGMGYLGSAILIFHPDSKVLKSKVHTDSSLFRDRYQAT